MVRTTDPASPPSRDRSNWTRLCQVFGQAVELAGEERDAYLQRACGAERVRLRVPDLGLRLTGSATPRATDDQDAAIGQQGGSVKLTRP